MYFEKILCTFQSFDKSGIGHDAFRPISKAFSKQNLLDQNIFGNQDN